MSSSPSVLSPIADTFTKLCHDPFEGPVSPRHEETEEAEGGCRWARFSSWLECVCVVTFDLELGQALELVYPQDVKLTEKESLVLLSRLPYTTLFHSLLQIIAPEYFEKLEPCLETVCNEIGQWPKPVPGMTLNLPVMGVILQIRIPSKSDKPGGSPVRSTAKENLLPAPTVLPTIHELDLFKCFQSMLIHLQMLWELVLLGEPLIVIAPSPTVSSEIILALVSSICPLKFCCDFRPYFTIHDSEFREYTTRTQAPPNVVLGVTNPFFIKTFQSWPHIIRLGELKMTGDLPKQIKVKKLVKLKTLDTKPGIYTAYKTFVHKDKILIKRLLKGIQRKRPSELHHPSGAIHGQLNAAAEISDTMEDSSTDSPFNQDEFMATLDHSGPQLTSMLKGDWMGLYRKFFRSPNFDGWYRQRHKEMTQKLECLHLEVICDADLMGWTKDKSEVEIVDVVLKLREKMKKARQQQLLVRDDVMEKLETFIKSIISSLPEDLQTLLNTQ
ncbi:hypothetical protein WMY93_022045 [Mugilogobius chulae]|uniref:UDENN domain-containing protein n=1 Tax=Mugilogobius chulae TaxID=88201 RepID=A0AAW0NDL6_9GOBI